MVNFKNLWGGYYRRNSLLLASLVLYVLFGLTACPGTANKPEPKTVPATGIKLDATAITLEIGGEKTLKATLEPGNTTETEIIWATGNDKVATVENGKITAIGHGNTDITATVKANAAIKAVCKVTVNASTVPAAGIKLDATAITLEIGGEKTLKATLEPGNTTETEIIWATGNDKVATVENGKITAIGHGNTDITATVKANAAIKAVCKVTVNAKPILVTGIKLNLTEMTLDINEEKYLTATIEPGDATNQNITWSSLAKGIADVDQNGKVTAKSEGKATILAVTKDGGFTAQCGVTVNPPIKITKIELNKTAITMEEKASFELIAAITPGNATDKTLDWETTDDETVSVSVNPDDCRKAIITAKKNSGSATITVKAKDGSNISTTCTVTLTNITVAVTEISVDIPSLDVGIADDTKKITAAVNADATNQEVEWESLDTGKATVNNSGQIFPKALGQVTLRVKAKGNPSITKDCSVTVVYNKVPYDEGLTTLKTFVNNIGDARTDYIELTEGWTGERFKGQISADSPTESNFIPSQVGAVIKAAPAGKKVYLKMPQGVSDLTDMTACFAHCDKLVELDTIPASVTVMNGTFVKCTGLSAFPALPNNVSALNYCFERTNAVSYPEVPGTAQDIKYTFYNCTKMTAAPKLNEGIKNMYCTFADCRKLESPPTLPTTVTNLHRTFAGCYTLTTPPAIPNTVTNLRETFENCYALKSVPASYPPNVTEMHGTFYSCNSLTHADTPFPASLKNMQNTFSGCMRLESVARVPASVTNLYSTFSQCQVLKTLTLDCPCPPRPEYKDAFLNCPNLEYGGVKVKSQHLTAYKKAANDTVVSIGCTADKFVAQ